MASQQQLQDAMWAGDRDQLEELAPCHCCCSEHTFPHCPARLWGGCRSGLAPGVTLQAIEEGWAEFYRKTRGMSRAEFFGEPE